MRVENRFLNYIMLDTQSDDDSETIPSTSGQLWFAQLLEKELKTMGVEDVRLTPQGYLYASIPSNMDGTVPVIGFIAHLDTADSFKGPSEENPPCRIKAYNGEPIVLESGDVLNPENDENLMNAVGCDIITTNGYTLLGGDDKAGVAEIMTAIERLLSDDIPHGKVVFAFTPDEEIGTSMNNFDTAAFGADFAYTIDGAGFGEIEYENFNGSSMDVIIKGKTTHPGEAKGKMINAAQIAVDFGAMLPKNKRPELTSGYEGFFHLMGMKGSCEECEMSYIIREADEEKYLEMKKQVHLIATFLNEKYGQGTVNITIKEDYANMAKVIAPHQHILNHARNAIESMGGEVKCGLIRGATDGASLSFMGVPCPNLGTGSFNHHSVTEFANVKEMEQCTELILMILKLYASRKTGN